MTILAREQMYVWPCHEKNCKLEEVFINQKFEMSQAFFH